MGSILKSLNSFFKISLAIFLLIISLTILSVAGYFGYQKYLNRNNSNLVHDHLCVGGDYLCSYITYKYDNGLKARLRFHIGPKYFSEDFKKDYIQHIKHFKSKFTGGKELRDKVQDSPEFLKPEIFEEIIKSDDNWVMLEFSDKDGFTIKEIKIQMNDAKTWWANDDLKKRGFTIEVSEPFSEKEYRKIYHNENSLLWSYPLIESIKLVE